MRIVVMSDSHGNLLNLEKIVRAQPTAEWFLFLGDGEEEFLQLQGEFPQCKFRQVRGNCDIGSQAEPYDLLSAAGKRIFFTHGHLYNVKWGMSGFLYAAKGRGADVALYGHTHIPKAEYEDGMVVLNPGSCSGRGGEATYAVVDITPAGIVPVLMKVPD